MASALRWGTTNHSLELGATGRLLRFHGFRPLTALGHHHSGLKNLDAQSNASEVMAAVRTYDAFGNIVANHAAWQGPFGYAGGFGYQEDATGLRLLGHRYYDPSIGRFLTRDPIKDGRNWYGYGGGHGAPTGFVDPTGLIAWVPVTIAVIVIIDIVDTANDVKEIVENPSDPINYIWPVIGAIDPTPGNIGKRIAKPSLSAVKKAVKEAHDEVGKIGGGGKTTGKFGAPQRVEGKRGYRLDPPHPNAPPGSPEEGWHIN